MDKIEYSKIPSWATPGQNNVVEEPLWWEAQNIPWQLVTELRRRSNTNNVGLNANADVAIDFQNQYAKYRGSMTPWVRAFSNGTGITVSSAVPKSRYLEKYNNPQVYQGFLLKGGDNFYDAYGLVPSSNGVLGQKEAIIGWDARGIPHALNQSLRSQYNYDTSIKNATSNQYPQNATVPSILPCPGIESINIKTNKDMMADATINWKCYSLAQLEYMMPFWLTPRINVFLEYGWNLFNLDSLLPLGDVDVCYLMIRYPQNALERYYKSFGNYGLITGIIKDFNFSTDDGIVYNCTTKIISRQAMYAGYRVDNPTEGITPENTSQYATVKDFFTNYLQFARDVIKATDNQDNQDKQSNGNYINYIITNFDAIKKTLNLKESGDKKKQSAGALVSSALPEQKTAKTVKTNFYNGQKENRMFMGRIESVYGAAKLPVPGPSAGQLEAARNTANLGGFGGGIGNPNRLPLSAYAPPASTSMSIPYGKTDSGLDVVSYGDKDVDFDYNDAGNDEVWFQLDFVFEVINFFCSTPSRDNNINIGNIVIAAHPNLISCDKNVLIPNPIAPKVNNGCTKKFARDNKTVIRKGYLTAEEANVVTNNFYNQAAWINKGGLVNAAKNKEKEYLLQLQNWQNPSSSTPKPNMPAEVKAPYWKAIRKCRETFGTSVYYRDNLDAIINWLYYHKGSPNPPDGSASFPFKKDQPINNKTYQAGYYGYLKHLYISKSKLIEIGKDSEIKTLQQLVNKILNTVNESVDNFWSLEVVNNPTGGLSIIDKNLAPSKEIYMFDLGSTSNVIKKVNFNVSLTNDQTNQILYGAGQNGKNPYAVQSDKIQSAANNTSLSNTDRINEIAQIQKGLPAIAFMDRFDSFEVKEKAEQTIKELSDANNPYPPQIDSTDDGAPHGPLKDENTAISKLQTGKPPEDVLTMRVRMLKSGEAAYAPIDVGSVVFDYVFLNLPSNMKDRLRQMLDDGDTVNNVGKYLGPIDNFTITLTLDGIMGLRMFQHFAIANLPKPYVPGNVIFMITEVEHQINSGKWETVITAMVKGTPDQEYKFIPV